VTRRRTATGVLDQKNGNGENERGRKNAFISKWGKAKRGGRRREFGGSFASTLATLRREEGVHRSRSLAEQDLGEVSTECEENIKRETG